MIPIDFNIQYGPFEVHSFANPTSPFAPSPQLTIYLRMVLWSCMMIDKFLFSQLLELPTKFSTLVNILDGKQNLYISNTMSKNA
jgi:hypothetical protein